MSTPDAWSCLVCLESGSGDRADLDARKHLERTGHATMTHLDQPWWAEREAAS